MTRVISASTSSGRGTWCNTARSHSLERQLRHVAFEELHVRELLGAVGSPALDQLRNEVHADDLADVLGERERERACPGPDVEHTLVAVRLDELEEPLGQAGQPAEGGLGDEVRVLREPLADCIVVFGQESRTILRERVGSV